MSNIFYMQLQITENFTIDKNTSEQHTREMVSISQSLTYIKGNVDVRYSVLAKIIEFYTVSGGGGLNIQRKAFVCVFFPFTFKDDQTNSWNTLYPRTLSQDPTLDERIENMPYAGITRRDVFRPGPLN